MNARRALLGALLAVLVVAAGVGGGLFLYSEQLYRDSYGSEYRYSVRIAPTAPVENVTVLVPLPADGGESPVDAAAVAHPFTPDGWAYDVVGTEHGPMLRVSADRIPTDPTYHASVIRDGRLVRWERISESEYDPDNGSHVRAEHADVEVDAAVESGATIDTRAPLESEPTLAPHRNRTETACLGGRADEGPCYVYDGRVFVSYDAAPDTAVYVSVELYGANSWWVFGWNFNEYADRQYAEVVGPHEGWVVTGGRLETGRGNYPEPPG